jgi:hypothetical protein
LDVEQLGGLVDLDDLARCAFYQLYEFFCERAEGAVLVFEVFGLRVETVRSADMLVVMQVEERVFGMVHFGHFDRLRRVFNEKGR